MKILRRIGKWLGLSLYGLNFWLLFLYGYHAFTPVESFIAEVLLVVLGPLFIFFGIKFFLKLKTQLVALALLYFGLFFMVNSGVWLGSVAVFLMGYFLEETFGRSAGLKVDFNDADEYGVYEAKMLHLDKAIGGHHMVNGINLFGEE